VEKEGKKYGRRNRRGNRGCGKWRRERTTGRKREWKMERRMDKVGRGVEDGAEKGSGGLNGIRSRGGDSGDEGGRVNSCWRKWGRAQTTGRKREWKMERWMDKEGRGVEDDTEEIAGGV